MAEYVKQVWKDAVVNEQGKVIEAGTIINKAHMDHIEDGIAAVNISLNTETINLTAEIQNRQTADNNMQTAINGKAALGHNHDAGNIVTGILPESRGGTGVTSMVGTDYTTNRPRGIILQATAPGAVANGCIVGVYK